MKKTMLRWLKRERIKMPIKFPATPESPKENGITKSKRNGHGKKTNVKGKKSKGIATPVHVRKK